MTVKNKIDKVLVANRGEIAIRICRAIKEEGMRSVAIYETPDNESRHISEADEAVWIGDGPRKEYLNIEKMIATAKKAGAQALHPGYGFLAENPELPKACEDAGLFFIGPTSQTVRDLGDKTIARKLAQEAGLKMIPGSGILPEGNDGMKAAAKFSAEVGYPIMLKAVAGGGGRGIRKVDGESDLLDQISSAEREAKIAFGDGRLYIEKGLVNPRHVEVQILGDMHGNIIHLGTRNCSIQRRHQKLVEIGPSLLAPELDDRICRAALKIAKHVGYVNAGTVEFLVDADGKFYFLEINTRLQVEHTVTEMISGIDIVRRQLRIAQGLELDIRQKDICFRGYSIELRINAEDPQRNFAPESGKVVSVYLPPDGTGIRLDGFAYQGFKIPTEYDSLIAKLTVYGFTWKDTVTRLARALDNYIIVGPKTTIPLYRKILDDPDFMEGRFDTGYIDRHPELFNYKFAEREGDKIAKLIAEIHYRKRNPFAG